jgi:hypothetical protein
MHQRFYELLTAYVDGELTNRQRKAVTRLLKKSPDARKLLDQLQDDASALRDLPRPELDRDLSAEVMARIRERRLQPIRRRQSPAPATPPAWRGLAIAASLLLAIGALSYVYFTYTEPAAGVAEGDKKSSPIKNANTVASKDRGSALDKDKIPEPVDPIDNVVDPDKGMSVVDAQPNKSQPAVDGSKGDNSKLGSPGLPVFDPTKVEVPFLPVVINLHELDKDESAAPFHDVLKKSTAFRLEVPCVDSHKGLDRLQKVLRANGFETIVDSVARDRAKIKARTNYVAYAENLTRDELFRLMKQLGIEERQSDGQLRDLVVTKLGKDDYKELSKWLSTEIMHPKSAGPLSVDPRKSVADGTADKVLDKLNSKSPAKREQHFALIAAPNANPGSAEVKRFLGLRKPVKPDSIQIMLVLRSPNG